MCYLNGMSQYVSIELSENRQLEKDIFNEDSVVNTPLLNITYRNNSNTCIYFKKISIPNKARLPGTVSGTNMNMPAEMRFNWKKKAEIALMYSQFSIGEKYRVNIGTFLSRDAGSWFLVNEADTCTECDIDLINDRITDIHEFIYRKQYPDRISIPTMIPFTVKQDLTEENILTVNSDLFVFLKPNEIHIDTFNIIAFQLIKGDFTFAISEDTIPDRVWIEYIWDSAQSKYIEQTAMLPKKIGAYNLYCGAFHTNEVKIKF